MPRRHYGVRVTKALITGTRQASASAWSGSALIGIVMIIMIAVCVVLYSVNKTITNAANTPSAEPPTTGEGTAR